MNKIYAISSSGKTKKSFIDLRFGKCRNIVIFDAAKKQYTIHENPFQETERNGIKLIDFLIGKGVNYIITGEIGPNVSDLLDKYKIQLILLYEEKIKIEDILNRINS